ncbi:MAG: 5-formyltetrahydrofolate cyclo-ligase [Bacteroidota bacterium]|nr:5-formyltetrahydrofolate cyclo-ligase [Bacteroidota bacterium]
MIDNKKKEIRKQIVKLKKSIPFEVKKEKSDIILRKLEKNKNFIEANVMMLYWAMKDEVNTHDFILKWYKKKKIILPAVKGENLELKVFSGMDSMKEGESYKILEPVGETFLDYNKIDIILVPGVAFDKNFNRLGRGKAYYDKLLKMTKATKLGVCFDFQIVNEVPVDEHDVKMDFVISD